MSPPAGACWKKLPIQNQHQSPNSGLFSRFIRKQDGLKFQVTDLVHLWTAAKTTRVELEEEASKTRCSIDPSEDEEQYEVLITKLEEAVSGCDAGKIQLHETENSAAHFKIETSIPLPPPLGVLEWTFSMVGQDSSALTQELLIPALRLIDAGRRREDELSRMMKEKDHVIGKLIDKIEGSGIDLGMVFPGFAGARKGLSARQAAKVVPGVEAFVEGEWKRKVEGEDGGVVKGILNWLRHATAEELVLESIGKSTGDFNNDQDRKLRVNEKQRDVQGGAAKSLALEECDSDTIETPNKNTAGHARSRSSDSFPILTRTRENHSNPTGPNLGKLGGRKAKPVPVQKDCASPPQATASRKLSPASTDSPTESDVESHAASTPPRQTPVRKPPAKMGIIGGRRAAISSKEKTRSPEPSTQASESPPSERKSRMGVIGGRREKPIDSTGSPSPPLTGQIPRQGEGTDLKAAPERSISPLKVEEPLTEAEKANRKRTELKRQLDQGKGGKKRRKF